MVHKHTTLSSSEFSQFPHQTSLLSPAGIFLYLCSTYSDKPRFGLFWGLWVPGTPHHHHFRDPCLPLLSGCPTSHFLPKGHTLQRAPVASNLSTPWQSSHKSAGGIACLLQVSNSYRENTSTNWAKWKWQNLPKDCSQICTPAATREHERFLHILPKGILMGERWVARAES